MAMPSLLVVARWLWPLALPLWIKGAVAMLLLIASQYHFWSKLSSGSVFAPEFPRPLIILFNWASGAALLLAALQILLDLGTLATMLAVLHVVSVPDSVRYAAAGLAGIVAAVGVAGALRVPPLKDIEIAIPNLPAQFDGIGCCS